MHIAVAGSTGLVGSHVVALLEEQGHTVTGIARETGIDLLTGDGLDEVLAGVDSLVDVTQSPTVDLAAVDFFEQVAANLGDAATRAGIGRTVVLSIIGIDDVPELDYYVAKVAQERAHHAHSPGLHILRAAQFHEFAGMSIGWGLDGDTTTIPDLCPSRWRSRRSPACSSTWPRVPATSRSSRSPARSRSRSPTWRDRSSPTAVPT